MHENEYDLCDFVEPATKSRSYSLEGVFSLILRHCMNLLGKFSRYSPSDSVEGRGNHHSHMMDPIDISSSDSDLEIEESIPREDVHRILPEWASGTRTNSGAGNGAPSWRVPSPKGVYTSNGSFSNINNHSQMKRLLHSYPNGDRGASNQHSWEDPKYFSKNGNLDQPWSVNSRIANVSGADYEKLSSQQALKRTLPASLHSHDVLGAKLNNSVGKGSSSQMRDTHGNPYHPAGTSSTESSRLHEAHGNPHHSHGLGSGNFKGYMKDHYSWNNNDDVMMYENNRSRILPPSLVHGASASSAQIVGSGDAMHRSVAGEERISENDERLIYQAALEGLNQPRFEVTPPDGLLSVPLLRHQKIALAWMLQKETKSVHCLGGILADDQGLGKTVSMIALILVQKSLESKPKSEEQCNHKTEALNLDDDDENGSTILDKDKQDGESDDVKPVPEVSTSTRAFSRRRPAAGTLVVCPASILRQWARELCDKVADESRLSVLVYHGGSRTKDPDELAKHDVVLTTYSIVTNEVPKQPLVDEDDADERNGEKYGVSAEISVNKKRKKTSNSTKGKRGKKGIENSSFDYDCGPLARVGWSRVILDEAQTIKNHRTQVARACCTLRAKRRWCLSGTPIQNAIDDLYSYFRFLRYDPYAVYKSFYNTIKVPISRNSVQGYKKLQAVLRAIMLRRTKGTEIDGQPIVKLPPKYIRLTKVDFSAEERAFYRQLEADSRSQFKAYAAAGTVNQNYANILLMLLRLRQACDHPLLVKGYNSDSVEKVSTDMAKRLPRDMVVNLLSCLEASYAICFVCDDPPEDPVVTMCGHVFCYQCVSEYLTGDDNMCPAPGCKEQLGTDNVFSKVTLRSCMTDDPHGSPTDSLPRDKSAVHHNECSSSKIRAVIEILQSHCKSKTSISDLHDFSEFNQMSASSFERTNTQSGPSDINAMKHSDPLVDGPIKTIVFSQWTSMLDLVEMSLNENCVEYRRLDGTMTLAARDRAVKDFNNDPEVTVMLMSLKAGNLGLNMVAACHVILLDLWWNPTTEDQAVDRAHRIGQTRAVTVTRMTIKDTVEDRILALQEEKRKMVASAFGEDQSGGSAARLTVEDLRYLFLGAQQ